MIDFHLFFVAGCVPFVFRLRTCFVSGGRLMVLRVTVFEVEGRKGEIVAVFSIEEETEGLGLVGGGPDEWKCWVLRWKGMWCSVFLLFPSLPEIS